MIHGFSLNVHGYSPMAIFSCHVSSPMAHNYCLKACGSWFMAFVPLLEEQCHVNIMSVSFLQVDFYCMFVCLSVAVCVYVCLGIVRLFLIQPCRVQEIFAQNTF